MLKGRHWLSQKVGFALTTAQVVDKLEMDP